MTIGVTEPLPVEPVVSESQRSIGALVTDYLSLAKSRIVAMVLMTTAAGFFFAAGRIDIALLLHALVGTALVAAGTNALNQYVERDLDALMKRTRLRPLPDGRMTPRAALLFSIIVAVVGTAYLLITVNALTAFLGVLTLVSYIFVYTPLKRVTTWCTLIGAIPGAIPPLMGWTAVTGEIGAGGWIVFGIVFLWQLPHFMAISWLYREDYARAGFRMTSVDDDGRATARQAVAYSIALIPVALAPSLLGLAGISYLIASAIAVTAFVAAAIAFSIQQTPRNARRLFHVSNGWLLAMVVLLSLA